MVEVIHAEDKTVERAIKGLSLISSALLIGSLLLLFLAGLISF